MEIKEGYVICSSNRKEKILRQVKEFKTYIFLTETELFEKLTFSVRKKAVYLLMKKYGFSYGLALEYIAALPYVEDKTYNHPKLDSLRSVFQYLNEKHCIIRDELFLYRLKQFPVTFVEAVASKEHCHLVEIVSQYTTVYEVSSKAIQKNPLVYEFQKQIDEVHYVFNRIKELLIQGVPLRHIYLIPSDPSYLYFLRRCANAYQIRVQFEAFKNLLSSSFIKSFLELCKEKESFQTIFKGLDSSHQLFPVIRNIINTYELTEESPAACLSLIIELLRHQRYPTSSYIDSVQLTNESMVFGDADYVFYLGFNLGYAPKVFKESGLLLDADLEMLHKSTSYDKTWQKKEQLMKFLQSTPNLIITYKLSANTEVCLPSLLIEELGLTVIHQPKIAYGFSKSEDDLRLVGLYDTYIKYGHWHEDLETYGLNSVDYKKYSHQYKPMVKEILKEHFDKKPLRLAYSSVKLFFACPFSYFADRILNLNEFKPQMAARLGTFSHAVLEDSYQPNFNFDTSVAVRKNENCMDEKDAFFFQQMTTVLRNIIDFNKEHESLSQLDTILQEVHIEVIKDTYVFEGYVDKLMYKIIGTEVYAAIVDYKTGADIVSLDNIEDGFHLQLPAYMYLLSKYEVFQNLNLHIIGIYLQKVNIVIYDHKSDIASQMAKKFMLEGYTVAEPDWIAVLDPTLPKSTYIKSLSMTKDGFSRYAKVYAKEEQNNIISMVERLLDSASEQIQSGNFAIAPKKILGKNVSCTFCKYKDICFYEYEDLVDLSYKPFGKAGDTHGLD